MGDYVDRQKLKEAISADCQHLFSFDTSLYEIFMIDIDEIPSENVREDVQGEWSHLGGDEWCCTVCGNVIHTEGSWEKPTKKFCDECGTRMKL